MSVTTSGSDVAVQRRSPHKLTARVRAVDEIGAMERDAMFAVMAEHYTHVTPNRFAADLAEKQWVLQLLDGAGRIRGFSTQKVLSTTVGGCRVSALYSGDTIVHRDHWGQSALAQEWGRFALQLIAHHGDEPLYWFLISKGYRTYRFLPVFFHEFYPRFDRAVPPDVETLLATLAKAKFGAAFDEGRGLVVADGDGCRLRPDLAETAPGRLHDPHIRYFVERNPGYTRGDELCCLAPLTCENFTPAARRVIGEAWR